jgi:hypothetical protein
MDVWFDLGVVISAKWCASRQRKDKIHDTSPPSVRELGINVQLPVISLHTLERNV